MFYNGAEDNDDDDNDQDYLDDGDGDDDDDDLDDDVMDEETQIELQKKALDRAKSYDSESNASPLPNQKKVMSLRHAATLADERQEHRSQNFESE